MEYRNLGRTGLRVSSLGLGCMAFGPGRGFMAGISAPERRAAAILDSALDRGINVLDVADVYQEGISEEILGRWMSRVRARSSLVVATKVGGPTGPGPNDAGLSRGHVLSACEASLGRLRTDYIDLYLVHWPDASTPIEETLAALDDLRRAGKIRYAGCSNFPAWLLARALWTSGTRDLIRFDCAQVQYSLAVRHVEREILPLCRDQGVGVVAWGALASGLLTGKHGKGRVPAHNQRIAMWLRRHAGTDGERVFGIANVVREIALDRGVPSSAVALAWTARHVTCCLVGARTVAQLDEDLAAADLALAPEEHALLDAVSALPPEYPTTNMDRLLSGGTFWD